MSYLIKNVPRSVKEVLDTASQDRVLTIVKNSVATYIAQFLDTMGVNRALAEGVGSTSLQYVTDKSLGPNKDDPSLRHVQLAKLTEDVTEKLPAILIADAGIEWIPSGIGHRDATTYENEERIDTFSFLFRVPITLIIVTNDEASTKDLTTLISLMFGPLQNLAGGSRIESENKASPWVISLPMVLAAPTFNKSTVQEDGLDHVWAGELALDLRYESRVDLHVHEERGTLQGAIVDDYALDMLPEVRFDGSLRTGESVDISVSFMAPRDTLMVELITPMSVTWENLGPAKLKVSGARPGTFAVIVRNGSGDIKLRRVFEVKVY